MKVLMGLVKVIVHCQCGRHLENRIESFQDAFRAHVHFVDKKDASFLEAFEERAILPFEKSTTSVRPKLSNEVTDLKVLMANKSE